MLCPHALQRSQRQLPTVPGNDIECRCQCAVGGRGTSDINRNRRQFRSTRKPVSRLFADRIEKARTVAEAIRARRVAQAWLARQHIRETTDFQFNETGTPHGDASVVAVMWRGLFKAMLESAETYGEGAS